jgi:arabinogalactan oligomer/maltooligosaccharide transport system substrate-binding protein
MVQLYLQHRSDQQVSQDQQRAATLQTYLSNMQDLLLNHKLATSTPGMEVSQVARVQTLTTLRSLDADRNKIVLQFLQGAHLIGIQNAVINLSNADLSNDDLNGANLSGVDLNGATLTDARLDGASLFGADLGNADLSGADLGDANLSDATLTGAFLGDTVMNHSILTGAHLGGAILTGAHLTGAYLSGADLNGAVLTGTDLSDSDLSDADLVTASLTQPQLDTVHSCTNATLYTGLTCLHNFRIDLTYWYTESPAEAPVILKLIRQFEQLYPKIHINAVYMNYFQTQTAFENKAKGGQAPDVLRSDVSWVAQFASQGYLLNIDSYTSQNELSDYLPTPLSYDYYMGHLFGLPQVTDFLALLYNKAELRKAVRTASPPSTMTNFEADAMKVVQNRAARYGFETDGTAYNVMPFLYAFGGGMLDQHNGILVNKPGSVAGLNFLLKLQKDRVMPANVNYSNGPVITPVTDFATGKTAMIFGGPYYIPEILAGPSFKSNPGNLGVAAIPTCPASTPTCHAGQTGAPSGGQSYVISAGTLHPIEAYKFISFMSQEPRQVEIAEANHTLPTRISAYKNVISDEQFISEFRHISYTARARPAIPQAGHLFDAFDPAIAAALDGVESPVAALNAVAGAWKQLLAG